MLNIRQIQQNISELQEKHSQSLKTIEECGENLKQKMADINEKQQDSLDQMVERSKEMNEWRERCEQDLKTLKARFENSEQKMLDIFNTQQQQQEDFEKMFENNRKMAETNDGYAESQKTMKVDIASSQEKVLDICKTVKLLGLGLNSLCKASRMTEEKHETSLNAIEDDIETCKMGKINEGSSAQEDSESSESDEDEKTYLQSSDPQERKTKSKLNDSTT